MVLVSGTWSGSRVLKINTSWFKFFLFRSFLNYYFFNFILQHLIYWELIFLLFFFNLLSMRLSQFYVHGREISILIRVNSSLFFLNFIFQFHPSTMSYLMIEFNSFIQFSSETVTLLSWLGHRFELVYLLLLYFCSYYLN
jgi:hypothetical protein